MKAILLSIMIVACSGLALKVSDTLDRCLTIKGEVGQYLHFSYMVRGKNEKNVGIRVLSKANDQYFQGQRELDISQEFDETRTIKVCIKSQDKSAKTISFFYKVKNSTTDSQSGLTLDHINESIDKLQKVQNLFDMISRNIYIKNDIDKELTEISIEAKQTQKYLSLIKMILVVILCTAQVYFITLFFTTGQRKKAQGRVSSGI